MTKTKQEAEHEEMKECCREMMKRIEKLEKNASSKKDSKKKDSKKKASKK